MAFANVLAFLPQPSQPSSSFFAASFAPSGQQPSLHSFLESAGLASSFLASSLLNAGDSVKAPRAIRTEKSPSTRALMGSNSPLWCQILRHVQENARWALFIRAHASWMRRALADTV